MMRQIRSPPVIRSAAAAKNSMSCCCCSCLNLGFFQTTPGVFKFVQMVLGGLCQSMLINFGTSQAALVGMSYTSLLMTNAACTSTVSLLVLCYVLSQKSFNLVRSSFFETLFNISAALSYLSSSTYLAIVVNLYMNTVYYVTMGLVTYPALVAAYTMGFTLGLLHALDAYNCYKHFRGY